MKSNIEKVYSKLPKTELAKVELATQKVELGLVDDVENLVNNSKKIAQLESGVVTTIAKALNEYKGIVSKSNDIISKSENLTKKIITQAKDLGINPKDVGKFDVLQNFTESLKKIEERYKKALKGI
mgnify:CR=1 FL=1|tara:strand:+ start:126 stop:503 length:378 start_codon:yes stop_codon:yes gene_type:complete